MSKRNRTELNVVRLSPEQSARVDGWALAHGVDRTDAIRSLIERGLGPQGATRHVSRDDAILIESHAARELDRLIDPETPQEERDRRIHRLTDGPPEFVGLRLDLPGRRPH